MRLSFVLGLLAFVNLAAGFATQWLVFFELGVGRQTDALFASLALPQVLVTLAAGPLANVLVPRFAGVSAAEAARRASSTALAVVVVSAPVILVLYIAAPAWVRVLLPGFAGAALETAVSLTRIQVLSLFVSTTYGVVWASAIAERRFVAVEGALALVGVAAAAAVLPAVTYGGIEGVAWVFSARSAARVLAILPLSRVRPTLRLRGAGLQQTFAQSFPLTLSGLYFKSESLLDQFLASLAPAGALSLFNLALTLQTAAVGIVQKALVVPLGPRFGALVHEGRVPEFTDVVRRYRLLGVVIGVVGFVVALLVGRPVLNLLIGHGGVSEMNVAELYHYVLGLGGLVAGLVAGQVVAYGLYALGATRLASTTSALSFTVGVGLKLGGFHALGVLGLAIGTSGYVLLAVVMSSLAFRRALFTYEELQTSPPRHGRLSS